MSPSQREYQIQYAVFFNHTTASCHAQSNTILPDSLVRIDKPPKLRIRNKDGSWLSSSSFASLRLLYGSEEAANSNSDSPFKLVISLSGRNHEEHFVSKLHFSWPFTSCASEDHAKGGRAVIASYKDSNAQIQKFAMRFPSVDDSVSFMNALKESLKNVRTIVMPRKLSESLFRSQDGCIPKANLHKKSTSGVKTKRPKGNVTQPLQPPLNNELLASFSTFLAKQGDLQQGHSDILKEAPSFSSLVNSMSSDSFMAMLYGMEKLITDLGGDFSLQL